MLVYAGHSFFLRPLLGDGPVITPVSRTVFALAAVVMLGWLAQASARLNVGLRWARSRCLAAGGVV